ncbi:MAG: trimethylamine methyltransferase family protein [Deltaproteobacteria bacterium]|nr:trimethylamine methyltransferase family protein [Deltaproteobacteria bacterium]
MVTNDAAEHYPALRFLSTSRIRKIYQATLTCLQRTGVEVHNTEAAGRLQAAGARVDGPRVRIPAHIIEDAVAATPPSFTIFGKKAAWDMTVGPGHVRFGPGPTCTYFIDPHTGERRKTRKGDPALTALACNHLENIDYVMSLGLVDDVTPSLAPVHEFAQMITHTGKPVLGWAFRKQHLQAIYRMAAAVAGSENALRKKPNFGFFSTWQAPLMHTDEDLANCLWAVEKEIPVIYLGGALAGMSAPVTGAGLLVSNLACMLSGLAIFQLKKPGAPVCLGAVPAPIDLRTARVAYGGPEMSIYSAAMSEIMHYLGLPFMGTAGASDAKELDLQAAIEGTLQVVLAQMSGADMVHDTGFLDCADIGSLEMLVMTDEVIAMAKRLSKGIEVNDETLMLDSIDTVGPGGTFIAEPETARRCRAEIFQPGLLDRDAWPTWQESGAESMRDRIREKLADILSRPVEVSLPGDVLDHIETILMSAEKNEK